MRAELSEKEVARRLRQVSRLRRLCLSLGRASASAVVETASEKEPKSGADKNIPGDGKPLT
jgi:hypothetical protein